MISGNSWLAVLHCISIQTSLELQHRAIAPECMIGLKNGGACRCQAEIIYAQDLLRGKLICFLAEGKLTSDHSLFYGLVFQFDRSFNGLTSGKLRSCLLRRRLCRQIIRCQGVSQMLRQSSRGTAGHTILPDRCPMVKVCFQSRRA